MKHIRINLTTLKSLVKSLASSTKNISWDLEVPGFGVYRTSSGRVSFLYQYRMPGHGEKTKSAHLGYLGELTVDQARAIASGYAHERRCGIDPIQKRRDELKIDEMATTLIISNYFEDFIVRRGAGKSPLKETQIQVYRRDVLAHIGHLRLDKLSEGDILDFVTQLKARGPSAHRSGLVNLKTLILDATKRRLFQPTDAHTLDIPKPNERDRRLEDDELQRLLEGAADIGDVRGDMIEATVRLAKRKDEVAEMPWKELDLANGVWNLPGDRNKSKKPWRITLPAQVIAILERQQPDPLLRTGPVFTLDGKGSPELGSDVKNRLDANMHRRLQLANERDGTMKRIAHFNMHDFRTAAASTLQEDPYLVSPSVIDAVLLHVPPGPITKIYQRSQLSNEAGQALKLWNLHIDQLMARESAWPGGRHLEPMDGAERVRRLADFRKDWPQRADQVRAQAARETTKDQPTQRRRKP